MILKGVLFSSKRSRPSKPRPKLKWLVTLFIGSSVYSKPIAPKRMPRRTMNLLSKIEKLLRHKRINKRESKKKRKKRLDYRFVKRKNKKWRSRRKSKHNKIKRKKSLKRNISRNSTRTPPFQTCWTTIKLTKLKPFLICNKWTKTLWKLRLPSKDQIRHLLQSSKAVKRTGL